MTEPYKFDIHVQVPLPSDGDARTVRNNTAEMLRRWFPDADEIAVSVYAQPWHHDPWSRRVA